VSVIFLDRKTFFDPICRVPNILVKCGSHVCDVTTALENEQRSFTFA